MESNAKNKKFKDLEEAILYSYNEGEIIGYKTVTVLPNAKVIKLDTGIQGVILSDNGNSSAEVAKQDARHALADSPVLSINRKFTPIFQDNPLILNIGGRASGKTLSTACAAVIETYKSRRNILVLRFNKSAVKDSIYSEMVKLIERFELEDDFTIESNQIVNNFSGSKLLFKGIKSSSLDVRDTLKGITELSTVLIEEAADLDKDFDEVFELLRGTMRDSGYFYRITITLNPRAKTHSIFKRFISGLAKENEFCGEHRGAYIITSTYRDNPALPEQFINNTILFLKKNNTPLYDEVYEGKWKDLAKGQIIKRFKVGKYEEHTPSIIGIDLGYRDETAAVMVSLDEDRKLCFAKLVLFSSEMTSEDLIIGLAEYSPFTMILDSSRPEIIDSLQRQGFRARGSKKGAGSVLDGITKMTSYEIIVDPENADPMLEAFTNYSWKTGVNEVPDHAYSHIPDALRYAISYQAVGHAMYHIGGRTYGGPQESSRYPRYYSISKRDKVIY